MQCSSGFECNARVFPLVAERKVPTGSSAMLAFFFCRGMQSSSRLKCNARFLCKECNVPPDSSATLVFSYRTGMQCSSRFECDAHFFVTECTVLPDLNAMLVFGARDAMSLRTRVQCSWSCMKNVIFLDVFIRFESYWCPWPPMGHYSSSVFFLFILFWIRRRPWRHCVRAARIPGKKSGGETFIK